VFTGSFTVPSTASLGTTVMRVMVKQGTEAGNLLPSPCDEPQDPLGFRGEVEDYNVIVSATHPNLTGIENNALGSVLNTKVFPNPSQGEINISLSLEQNTPVSIQLFDFSGKQLQRVIDNQILDSGINLINYSLSEGGYANGVYYIKISTGNKASFHKVVKVN
jgi:outer membrane lipoprotein-sorting protein